MRSFTERKRIRKSFSRIQEVAELPNLISLQKDSYEQFLQIQVSKNERNSGGLSDVFKSIFPIKDSSKRLQLEYTTYDFVPPKYDEDECKQRGLTFSSGLRVTFRLIVWDVDEDTGARSIKDIKEQDVYMGDVPLMTNRGTFIINGIERVVVSQMHRSPGVFFDHDFGKGHSSGKYTFISRIVPYRGSWIDFELDPKDMVYVRIDRRRKVPVTTFLMALDSEDVGSKKKRGMSQEEILTTFYEEIEFVKKGKSWMTKFIPNLWKGVKLQRDLVNADTGETVLEVGTKLTVRLLKGLVDLKNILITDEDLIGRYIARDFLNKETGEIYIESGDEITSDVISKLRDLNVTKFTVLHIDNVNVGGYLLHTLKADKNLNREDALLDIYRALRPGEPPTMEGSEALFKSLFFDPEKYDLSAVGRVKMNDRLGLDAPDTVRILRKEDIIALLKELLRLRDGHSEVDDIDNLGNRRVRSVGELLENQFRIGVIRMERTIKERMGSVELDSVVPHDLINSKPVGAAIREFFTSSQLSQFMDQTNPLSEITHKRRLSALGPGGLSRDRAGFEVRDVHPTHYGRICPIETPEGPNIGLINSLSTYARINAYGFIESPYRKVKDQKVTDEIVYLAATQESKYTVAQSNLKLTSSGEIADDFVMCRRNGEFGIFPKSEVDLMDVSAKQMVSVAASLIPFLENDDASRALMGSNMQRQAVPLIVTEAPFIGTGMEKVVARDSGVTVLAKRPGVVAQVDAKRIVVHVDESCGGGVDLYQLQKFQGSNMNTCINQKPLVRLNDKIKAGDIIADGPSTDMGELALGRNVLVAFMSWQGYNFEDSIVLSEKIVEEDVFTSIHIEGFEVFARDTKLGNEEITRDIPNVNEEHLKKLDETGIVYIGAEVHPGDILIGKVTPKNETIMTPEEKLLRAIFGEKASDVRDSSLRVPAGVSGTVVGVRVFSRKGLDRDDRSLAIEKQEIETLTKDRDSKKYLTEKGFFEQLVSKLSGKETSAKKVLTNEEVNRLTLNDIKKIKLKDSKVQSEIDSLCEKLEVELEAIQDNFNDKVEKLRRGDELPPGVLKMVKVFIAVKRKIQVGDKMAGRHGNKGVVSKILPVEDMPYLEDGTPVDMILNPLGVPSRMNVGQILETHLGAASAGFAKKIQSAFKEYKDGNITVADLRSCLLDVYDSKEEKSLVNSLSDEEIVEVASNTKKGVHMASPVFDGARLTDIENSLKVSNLPTSGQVELFDGRNGEKFERPISVGYIYMLKLHHLVDDKIHARSIGPYSLVTQQPLGGKAQFGGQRFGEMEVWALEAYGAAYTLKEMLTIKSDDVSGRTRAYEAIVRGDGDMGTGVPESFNVLVKELRSLGLNMSFC